MDAYPDQVDAYPDEVDAYPDEVDAFSVEGDGLAGEGDGLAGGGDGFAGGGDGFAGGGDGFAGGGDASLVGLDRVRLGGIDCVAEGDGWQRLEDRDSPGLANAMGAKGDGASGRGALAGACPPGARYGWLESHAWRSRLSLTALGLPSGRAQPVDGTHLYLVGAIAAGSAPGPRRTLRERPRMGAVADGCVEFTVEARNGRVVGVEHGCDGGDERLIRGTLRR